MNRSLFQQNMLELIRRTSAFLPPDIETVSDILTRMSWNAGRRLARGSTGPTGTARFW